MDELVKKLTPIGLTEKEAQVYVALLQLGRASAYSVATKSGLKKPTVYVILGQLIEKGLAIEVPREKKQFFAPRPPEDFISRAENRVLDAKRILPELSSLFKNFNIDKARTMYFDGVNGVRQALWYKEKEMRGKEFVGFFAGGKTASKEIIGLYHEYNDHCKKNNIKIRGFTVFDEKDEALNGIIKKHFDSSHINFKFLPPELYNVDVSIDVAEDFVRIDLISVTQAVIIESKDFAKMVRQLFEIMWQYAPALTKEEAIAKLKL